MVRAIVLFFLLIICMQVTAEQTPPAPATDTVLVAASDQYSDPSLLNLILLGKNYRKDWSTPVSLPVFNLKASGMTIVELGGGMQTKTLDLKDAAGEEWALRTVDKDPSEALHGIAKNKLTVQTLQQLISAAQPYAPLTIPTLAKAAGVTVTHPTFYWVPNDAAFGKYRDIFANTVCLLERKDVTPEKVKTIETKELVDELLQSNTHQIDEAAYLRARLLDMLIGDWDRHQDQWVWAAAKQGNLVKYEALPKDRDQAYFRAQGVLVKLLSFGKLKHIVGFTRSSNNIKKLNNKSWNMDRLFLNKLNYADWKRIAQDFYDHVTPEVIDQAIKKLPPEIYAISGKKLTDKLVQRRNGLVQNVLRYYRFLSRHVTVYGSSEPEVFTIKGNKDSVTVTVANKQRNTIVYARTFYATETKSIQLLPLGGNDVIDRKEIKGSKIKINIDTGMNTGSYTAVLRDYLRIKK